MIEYDKRFKAGGEFYLPETKRWFTFKPNTDPWAIRHNLIHEIHVGNVTRSGIVRQSVAYIAVDEDKYGNPVLERWSITKRKELV